jgi:hypothetical protein
MRLINSNGMSEPLAKILFGETDLQLYRSEIKIWPHTFEAIPTNSK